MKPADFKIGAYRPIYLWAGPGTIRMNRLKFMDGPVDEWAHHEAHTPAGARRVVDTMDCNWVHLMYDWGFPPEVEAEDWAAFEEAAQVYHRAGETTYQGGQVDVPLDVYTILLVHDRDTHPAR